MSVRIVGETRLGKRVVFGLAGVLVIALLVGFLAGGLTGEVSPVYAAWCSHGLNYLCSGGTTTSALDVSHHTAAMYGTQTVVEPDDGERWAITAQWCPFMSGQETLQTAYATVSWDGSDWALSNVSYTTDIVNIGICQGDTCDAGGGSVHSWNYKLIVDINDPEGSGKSLAQVTYTTTVVDDGYLVIDPTETQGDCDLGSSVSPTSQTFSAVDSAVTWSVSRCPFDCDVDGASVTLYYE